MNCVHMASFARAVPSIRTSTKLPIILGEDQVVLTTIISFNDLDDGKEHVAIRFGDPDAVPLVRLHSECLTGDVFGSEPRPAEA